MGTVQKYSCQRLADMLVVGVTNGEGRVLRQIYFTAQPFGEVGTTGQMAPGDLKQDLGAKIIYYDPAEGLFKVTRNGNPPQPEESVPKCDIAPLLRSFARDQRGVLSVTDTNMETGMETIRLVVPLTQIETFPAVEEYQGEQKQDSSTGSGTNTKFYVISGLLLALVGVGVVVYLRRRKAGNKDRLPDIRPFVVAKRHGVRDLMMDGDSRMNEDVKSTLRAMREEASAI